MTQQQNAGAIASGTRGKMVREVAMQLKDLSLSGCLVESDQSIRVGAAGTLVVDLWGVACRYPLRVARVTERPDASHNMQIAGVFTWNPRPAPSALSAAVDSAKSLSRVVDSARPSAKVLQFPGPSTRRDYR